MSETPEPPPASSRSSSPDDEAGSGSRRGRRGRVAATPLLVESQTEDISLAAILGTFLRHRRVLFGLPLAVAILWVLIVLVLPRQYTTQAQFTPSSGNAQLSQLAGLASQFGVNVPQVQTNESPAFYADLLQSRELLRSAVTTTYTFPTSADADSLTGDLVELFGIHGDRRDARVAKTIEEFQDHISVSTDAETGVVSLSVTTRWADLSRQLGERLLDLVNTFNLQTRQTQASAERRFLEERVVSARNELRSVEDSLQQFLEHNRSYQNSPQLQFEYDRLQRRVSLQQQVYTTLAQSLEQAKIDQVRNTPVITVVEPPEAPPRPDRRGLIVKGILGLLVGGVAAAAWAVSVEWSRHARHEEPEEYRRLEQEWADTREDVRRLWRRLVARLRRRKSA